jgi:lipid A 3-O-deacylase
MNTQHRLAPFLLTLWAGTLSPTNGAEVLSQPTDTNSNSQPAIKFQAPAANIWQEGVGEGFRSTVQTLSAEVGVDLGVAMFGGRQSHDFALTSLSYGHMWGPVRGEGHWYRGNFEFRAELFGGGQYSPSKEWLIGLTPHFRYNFATGTRWIPFCDAGAGVAATGIGAPDLSGTFEFNLQPAIGVQWFLRDNLALTSELKYLHISCGGIHSPNLGANGVVGMIGLTWFFGK